MTENRAAFMPWLTWGFRRQTWPHKELIIVDSSPHAPADHLVDGRPAPDVRVIVAPPGTNVPSKRNLALDAARGDFVAFFDDDDWQHPERLQLTLQPARDGADVVGTPSGWFVDLWGTGCQRHAGAPGRLLFNASLFRRELAQSVRFDEQRRRASDTHWLHELLRRPALRSAVLERDDLFFWLCHDQNLSNPRGKRRLDLELAELVARLGVRAWADTEARLECLRAALGTGEPRARVSAGVPGALIERGGESRQLEGTLLAGTRLAETRGGVGRAQRLRAPIRERTERLRPLDAAARHQRPLPGRSGASGGAVELARRVPGTARFAVEPSRGRPPVSMVIKATILDADYLGVLVPHMVAQAKYPLAETVIVVDPRLEFDGKYALRSKSSRERLERVLSDLAARGIVDRVVQATPAPEQVADVLGRYFGRTDRVLPTHDVTGSPIFPALLGLEEARTDHVVLMDCDMFFHGSGDSWVAAALDVLTADASIWLMMTHAGPPAGALGTPLSLGLRNAARAVWDEHWGIWRFKSASTRYFLTDRRRLRGKISPVWRGAGLLPLEACISHSLERHGAYRGNLAREGSWDLHAHSHDSPFPEWASAITDRVVAGVVPELQRGEYDLRLDRAATRSAWAALLHAERETLTGHPAPSKRDAWSRRVSTR